MAPKKATRGKRYTAEEKQSVVDFVNSHNEANGVRKGIATEVRDLCLAISA